MYQEKKYKLGRRLGAAVIEQCQTPKFAARMARRKTAERTARRSDYGYQLIDKQRVRVMYGVGERQFRNYITASLESKTPAKTLFELLEMRLDNVVYRLGFAPTRRMARQMVSHGHITVNDRRTKVPSYTVSTGDVIVPREGSKKTQLFSDTERLSKNAVPTWLTFDASLLRGTVKGRPTNPDPFLNFQSVIEFYSR